MGAHSKTAVIRRRRTRKEKMAKLRKRYLQAVSDEERHKITEKVKKLSPFLRIEDFVGTSAAAGAKKPSTG